MSKLLFAAVLAVLFVPKFLAPLNAAASTIAASPTPAASPSPATAATASTAPAPTVAPEITARAKEWLHRFQTGNLDRTQLNAEMNTALTPDLVKQVSQQLAPLGEPVTFVISGEQTTQGVTAYIYKVSFKSTSIYEVFGLDKDGKLAAIRFVPVQ
ncbi:MAG TPA: hypothetical protein VGF98_08850 [Candidatus Tumulicola sp.]|jgi:hypothetical protein